MFKLLQILIAGAVALFFLITVSNNIGDYSKTFAFVSHTLSMDTTSSNPNFMGRAIHNPVIQHAAFLGIIVLQIIIALLLSLGITYMIINFSDAIGFSTAKNLVLLGCCLGFILYGLGFLTVAGQWFMTRESTIWNVQNSVHTFITFMGVSLIYLSL